MLTAGPLVLRVEIDRDTSPISGRIGVDAASEPFAGWTELCAAVAAAVASDRGAQCNEGGDRRVERP
ncbi:MAG: hypothetical protein ACXVUL_12695 [Solirubrobacteraceae bacterium]